MAINWGLVSDIKLDPAGAWMEGRKLGDEQRIKNDRRVALAEYVSETAARGGRPDWHGLAAKLLSKGDMEGGQQFLRLAENQTERDYQRGRDVVGDKRWQTEFGLKEKIAGKPSTATTQVVNPQTGELETIIYDSETGKRINTIGKAAPKPADFTTVTIEDTEGKPTVSLLNKTTGKIDPVGRKPAEPKPLAHTDIKDLNAKGKALTLARDFVPTFNDQYGGWKSQAVGETAMLEARNWNSGLFGNNAEAADWWQSYNRYKNVVRNELFGSALTSTEKAAFEAADINPGMTPAAIKANLAAQKKAAEQAALILASPYVVGGRNRKEVEAALGFGIDTLPGSHSLLNPGLPPGTDPPKPAGMPKPGAAPPPPVAAGPQIMDQLPFAPKDVATSEPQEDGSVVVTLKDGRRLRVRPKGP